VSQPGVAGGRSVDRLRAGERVVVIGAGPAGLTAAYQLAKQGVPVTVLEASSSVGGLSRTAQYNGYRFDIGGHRFFTKSTVVQDLWEEILGDQFISVRRLSRIAYNGRFFDYPLTALNALTGLGAWNATRCIASYVAAQLSPSPVEENLEQWVSNRFGRRLYEIFFKTYTEKVWGMPCTEIRAEWAAQRIRGLSLPRAILSAMPLTRRGNEIKTLIDEFRYPRLGPGQMWEAAAERITQWGAQVLLERPVSRLELRDGRVTAAWTNGPDGATRFAADHFISTMALGDLMRAFGDSAPAAAREGGAGLKYRDFILVALIVDQDDLFPDNWIYVHTPGVRAGRIQNFNNWSRAMSPRPGHSCLGMEYFCFEGDGLWTSDDRALIELATRELGQLGLARGAKVVDGTVVRVRKAYPVYDAAYRSHLDAVRSFLDPIPNLHTVGRNGMHKYNNQDHSMLTAMMAVANMRGESHDVWSVNTDFDYHEEQRLSLTSTSAASASAAPSGVDPGSR
jgi:protoporphyrinogen oxidase